jgi:crotonobetainyl-CoA:carnitine CoA-transferase CaiB-like acyl-CoA transferase
VEAEPVTDDTASQDTASPGALQGFRVLELSTVIMGPYGAQILGDLGADVIKVETDEGDSNRDMGGGPHNELSGIALNINRNKRAVSLDLKAPAGREAFLRILDTCDVLVTNIRPGPLARLKLAYEDVSPGRPGLVFCQAQGFRSGTGEENRPAYDDIIQAATGFPRLTEITTGKTAFLPSLIADKVAGQTIVQAVLAALLYRERTGKGQRVEVPMFNAVFAFALVEHLSRAAIPGEPAGYSRIMTTTRGPHRTRDGYIAMMPYTDAHWHRLFAAVGHEELLDEPWFGDRATRLIHAQRVYAELAAIVAERTTGEWLELCEREGIPANPVPSLDEILADEALHRGMISVAEHPVIGNYRVLGPGMIFDETPITVRRPAPRLSEHTAEILSEVGYTAEEISTLVADGVAGVPKD